MATLSAGYLNKDQDRVDPGGEARSSGVAWGAVIGGAFVAAAFYLIMLALGTGLGLSALSPWASRGASAIAWSAIVWLLFTNVVASALGGYITGRLSTKWAVIHNDEVYFRDTANGFLSWAVALVISVTMLTSAAASMLGRATDAGVVGNSGDPTGYYFDKMFRSTQGEPAATVSGSANRIFANALRRGSLPAEDRGYLTNLIAEKTGVSRQEAEKRVDDATVQAQVAADNARKETARFLLWSFVALMMGAFSASYAATIGGRQRDDVLHASQH